MELHTLQICLLFTIDLLVVVAEVKWAIGSDQDWSPHKRSQQQKVLDAKKELERIKDERRREYMETGVKTLAEPLPCDEDDIEAFDCPWLNIGATEKPTTTEGASYRESLADKRTKMRYRAVRSSLQAKPHEETYNASGTDPKYHQILEGIMVELVCDYTAESQPKSAVVWKMGGLAITTDDVFAWRRRMTGKKRRFRIYSAHQNDTGHYECLVDGILVGQISMDVITVRQAVGQGTFNFLICAPASLVVILVLIVYRIVMGDQNVLTEGQETDMMEEFYRNELFLDEDDHKSAKTIVDEDGVNLIKKAWEEKKLNEPGDPSNKPTSDAAVATEAVTKKPKNMKAVIAALFAINAYEDKIRQERSTMHEQSRIERSERTARQRNSQLKELGYQVND